MVVEIVELHDDVFEKIVAYLPIIVLLRLLQTCKRLYCNRYNLIQLNEEYAAYKLFDMRVPSYFSVYFQSDMTYHDGQYLIKTHIDNLNITYVYNTYKLCAFYQNDCTKIDQITFYKQVLKNYFAKKYVMIYGEHPKLCARVYETLFEHFIIIYDWAKYTHMNIFDIYEILYHAKLRNIRRLTNTIQNMVIYSVDNKAVFVNIMGALLKFWNTVDVYHVNKRLIKASVFYILYKFAEINVDLLPKTLGNAMINHSDMVIRQLMNAKNGKIPLYFKNVIIKQIDNACITIANSQVN
jgi:hypothetical protein